MSERKNQYLAALCINLTTVSYGMAIGWSSPSLPILLSDDSPLETGPISPNEAAMISAVLCVGGALGAISSGFIIDQIGRKPSLLMCGLLQIVSWLLIPCLRTVFGLYLSRGLGGFVAGAVYVIIPTFVTEISDDQIRGTLGSFLMLMTNLGCVIGLATGAFMDYLLAPFVGLFCSSIFFLWMIFIPETPCYLLVKRKMNAAEESQKYYHPKTDLTDLIKRLEHCHSQDKNNSLSWADFSNSTNRKAIIISVIVMVGSVSAGNFIIVNNSATIFGEAGAAIHPNISSVIIGLLQLIGSYISTIFADRLGRKLMLSVSAFGTAASLFCMGLFSYLKSINVMIPALAWGPLICLSVMFLISSAGISPLPYVAASEILPQNLRGPMVGINTILMWIVSFLLLRYFAVMASVLMIHGIMWTFGVGCLLYTLFTLIFLPETKGKSPAEIAILLSNKK